VITTVRGTGLWQNELTTPSPDSTVSSILELHVLVISVKDAIVVGSLMKLLPADGIVLFTLFNDVRVVIVKVLTVA
jgi:hypothetical protein